MLVTTSNGTVKLKTERKGIVLGEIYGSAYESNKTVAKTELIKNKNL